jgi:hypothetical protein
VLPRRWVVERTFAWISKHRRTVRDYETLPASHEAMILWAMIALMTRRLTQPAELSDAHLASRLTSAIPSLTWHGHRTMIFGFLPQNSGDRGGGRGFQYGVA